MRSKKIYRFLSAIMVFAMLLTMLPAHVLAAVDQEPEYAATVYVDGSSGSNSNSGETAESSVKTMTVAYEKLYTLMEAAGKGTDPEAVGRIVVVNDVSFSSSTGPTPFDTDPHVFTIVVTGQTPDKGLLIKKNYNNLGPTVYENITLTKHKDSENLTYFCGNGYPLTIGEGVTTVAKPSGHHFNLVGGKSSGAYTGDSSLIVESGTWRNLYVGNYQGNMTGDATLVMTGGTVENTMGSTYSGKHKGDLDITITGGSVAGNLYAGVTYTSGTHTGDVTLSISGIEVDANVVGGGRTGLTGNLTMNIADATLNGTLSAQCTGTEEINLTASKGNTLSISSGSLDVDSFTGGGTLVTGDSVKLNMGSVTGETTWQIDGTPYDLIYITTPDTVAENAFAYVPSGSEQAVVSTTNGTRRWSISGGEEVVAFKLTAPEDVSLTLRSGFSSGAEVAPDFTSTEDGITTYTYNALAAGNYNYVASGTGYYTIQKNIYYSAEEAAVGMTVDANPGKRADDGFQQTGTIALHTDEVMDTILASSPDLWPEYAHIFQNDAVFTDPDRANHLQTTQEELMATLAALDGADDDMYCYVAGYTPVYGYEIPVAIFTTTDLSGAKTLEEAAALVNANGKATIHYQGMIHPNEPAGGSGAVAMIHSLDGDYGAEILDTVNIYVIPRINGDGAHVYQRANVAEGIDMNRDHLFVQSDEIEIVHKVYNLFMPEVTIDGHEFSSSTTSTSNTLDDVQVGAAGSLNSDADVNEIAQEMVHASFDAAFALGLRPYNYGSYASTVNNAIGRAYYGLYGSLSFLIETRGIGSGLGWFERRTMSQYVVAETLIDYVVANEEAIRTKIAAAREDIAAKGQTYDTDDLVVLKHGVSKAAGTGYVISRPTWNLTDGSVKNADATGTIYRYDVISASRPRPTAYVIPKGQAWAEEVTAMMDKNGISYYELDANSAVLLQQYMGDENGASLTGEKAVTFETGAYVFPMNQVGGNVLAMTMEPDVIDSEGYNGTLLQSGVVDPDANNMLPIYRYTYDLDSQGKIQIMELPAAPTGLTVAQPEVEAAAGAIVGLDPTKSYEFRSEHDGAYTAVPAGSTSIDGLEVGIYYVRYAATDLTLASLSCELEVIDRHITNYVIYVDGVNGSNDNSGRKETVPVATLEVAYAKLTTIMKYAPEGTTGIIKFVDTVTLKGDTQLPAHSFPVLLTSVTGAEGITSGDSIGFNGDTTLKDIQITLTTKNLRYIAANGNTLVVDENVTCVPAGTYYYNIAGGTQSGTLEGDTNLTIKSGSFRNVYAAGYKGTVIGNANLTISGGNVTSVVQTSYSGATNGNVTMDLSNASIGGIVYAANTSSNDVNGNVTLRLGENLTLGTVYAGSRDAGSVSGTVTIILDGAEITKTISGGCANTTGSVAESVIILKSGAVNSVKDADKVILDTSAGGTVRFNGSLTVDEVVGGGTVAWTAGETLTVNSDAVSGETVVVLDGDPADAPCIITPESVDGSAFLYQGEKLFRKQIENGLAYWCLKDAVSVTFVVEGLDNQTIQAAVGDTLTQPEDPSREGYKFTGWYLEDGSKFDFSTPVQTDLVLTAGWEVALVSVTFVVEGYDDVTIQIPAGETLPQPESPTRKGYKFTGWYLEDGSKFDFSTPVQSDLVLTAGWQKDNSFGGFNSWLDWSISIYKYTVTKWLGFIGSWFNPFGR